MSVRTADAGELTTNIDRISARTAAYPELQLAHHFLYDLRRPPNGKPQYVVMGINPGETPPDWETSPNPTEETSRHDFHVDSGRSRSTIRWGRAAEFFLDEADYVLTEAFFWSSKDGKQFKERFGDLAASPHLPFCTEMNQQLIEAYMPKAIIAPGLGLAEVCRPIYGLKFEDRLVCDKGRLAECYTDGIRPWVFTKHWTASFGFSNNQRSAVRDYIRSTWLPAEV